MEVNKTETPDYVKELLDRIKSIEWIGIIIIIGMTIIGIQTVWEKGEWIYYKFVAKPNMSDEELTIEATQLVKDIANFIRERRLNEPKIDYENWDEYTDNLIKYSKETMDLYNSEYITRVAEIREEFKRRGITNENFEDYYEHPTNVL
jgi:hypothetical protein